MFKKLKQTDEKGTLFKQGYLEVFTKTNPLIHVITYGGATVCCVLLNKTPIPAAILYFACGVLVWTLKEYLIHRFIFHIKPSRLQYIIHGVHHEFPKDQERLLMPPLPGTILFLIFTAFWAIFLQHHVFIFMAGLTCGYMFYTFVHYIVHAYKPIRFIKFWWEHHHKHHNPKFEDKAFGVSTPLWDIVFGTMPQSDNTIS